MKLCFIYRGRGSFPTEKIRPRMSENYAQEILNSKRTSIITPPHWAKIETLEAYRHKFSEVEGPYSYYRRILTKSELIQLNLPDPNLCGVNLKNGCKLAIDTVVKLLQNGKYNELKDLFADRPLSKANYDEIIHHWKNNYKPKDKKMIIDSTLENSTVNSSVTRVENVHWRNKAQIDVKLQLECCVISKLISSPSYYNGSDAMDLYNIFHVYFEKEYGSYMNNKFVPSDSNWKLLKIQSFL
jgi:hypothetical protein